MSACPKCGAALPDEGWEGLCPICLVHVSLESPVREAETEVWGGKSSTFEKPQLGSFGDFELVEEIARGGMGIVYKARQKSLGRTVALKMLLLRSHASGDFIKRFRIEASAAAALRHPNIVAIHEVGVHADEHFLVMDYVDGPNLAKLVKHQPLPAKRAATYLKTIAEATHYAHEQGILHRDLKPSNVLIDSDDQPHVTDFGLAKRLRTAGELATDESQLTFSGQVMGSPGYMSPEQASGARGKISRCSDVYSLGATFYHLLTGRPPFAGESLAETLQQVQHCEPISPRLLNPSVPPDVETICLKCLEKDPSRRYLSAQALANELQRVLNGEPIYARPVTRPERLWRWCRRKPVVATLTAIAFGLFVSGLGGILWQWRRAEKGELAFRQRAYVADMNLIHQAIKASNLGRARELLDRNRPKGREMDLRDWEWRYLWARCRSGALFSLARGGPATFTISLSPDGKLLVSGDVHGGVKIWDVAARQLVTSLSSDGQIALVAFAPRGNRLATTAEKGVVKVWETGSWIEGCRLRHAGAVRCLNFSPDGELLAVLARDQGQALAVSLWSLDQTNLLASLPAGSYLTGHHGMVLISPNQKWLAVGESDGHICVYELRDLAKRFDFAGHTEGITALAFSADSELLASGSGFEDATIRLWSLVAGTETGTLEGHRGWITALAFAPVGKMLASASADYTIGLWDANERKELASLRGHQQEVWGLSFFPQGNALASATKDGEISVWNVRPKANAAELLSLPGVIEDACFTSDDNVLATQNGDGAVSIWDISKNEEIKRLTALGTNNFGILFSPDKKLLAVGNRRGFLKLVDLAKADAVRNFTSSQKRPLRPVSFTRDGKFLFGSSIDTHVAPWTGVSSYALWEVDSGRELGFWSARPGTTRIGLSPDGVFTIEGAEDGTVRFWRRAEHFTPLPPVVSNHYLSGITFAPDGKRFATASTQGEAMLWDFATRIPVAKLRGHARGVHGVAFSPDGRRLATTSGGRETVMLWDMNTHEAVLTLEGQGSVFHTVQFSPKGTTLMAINTSGRLHLWRAPSKEEIEAAENKASMHSRSAY